MANYRFRTAPSLLPKHVAYESGYASKPQIIIWIFCITACFKGTKYYLYSVDKSHEEPYGEQNELNSQQFNGRLLIGTGGTSDPPTMVQQDNEKKVATPMIGWALFTLAVTGLALVAWGAFHIQANFFVKAIHSGNTANKRIALTFDDGPHPIYTPQVLKLLGRHHAKATFFCIGKNVMEHASIVKQIHHAGHTVGNHSFTHSATIDFHGKAGWLDELRQTDKAIEQAIGRKPTFFRPPYGVTTPHLAKAVRTSGHRAIGWRIRPYDTLNKRSPAQIARAILRMAKPGTIALLHDTHDRIVPVLEQLLPELHQRGYTFVTVAELINDDAYIEI